MDNLNIKEQLKKIQIAQEKGESLLSETLIREVMGVSLKEAEDLHKLGFLCIQQNLLKEAQQAFEQAILSCPNSPVLYNHLGNVHRRKGSYFEAEQCFKKALEYDKNYAEAYNNYGLLSYQKEEYKEAENLFLIALKIKSDYINAMYNLALALYKQNKKTEAIASLMAILEEYKEHFQSRFLLAKWLLKEKFYEEAEKHFQKSLESTSDHPDMLVSIIKTLLDSDHYREAQQYCKRLLKKAPHNVEAYYNLGVINSRLGEKQEAIVCYENALRHDPSHFPSLNNVAVLYLEQGSVETAKYYFQKAMEAKPDDAAIHYTMNAISGEKSFEQAPKEYISKLFDSYAEHFEVHLREGLEYRVPELLKKQLVLHCSHNFPFWSILDLGCGTGLCGVVFKEWAKRLVGVDLSSKMIELAKQKNCYDELSMRDNLDYLSEQSACFNLILAADVFVYQGKLEAVFAACKEALVSGGLFAFSTERYQGKGFAMQSTGRFCHSHGYIEELAEQQGFGIIVSTVEKTRLQQDNEVAGSLFVLKKPSES